MAGLLFAVLCWAVWYLSPHNVALLAFDKEAIAAGEWWRLWTAHFTHFKFSQLILNSAVIALMGLMLARFTKLWQVLLSLLIAMPIMTGLLLLLMPDLIAYRGAFGVTAMMVMMAVWFLIVEDKRFSLAYWLGLMMLLLFVAKVGLETWLMLSHADHHVGGLFVNGLFVNGLRMSGLHADWLVQCFGILLGLAFFNALHQIYATRTAKNKHYRGASIPKHLKR